MPILNFNAVPSEESQKACLQRLREHTCYRALRTVLAVCAGIGYLCVIGLGLSAAFGTPDADFLMRLGMGAAALLLFLLTAAGYQAASLLVDIADAEIERTRRK
jgi:hypothetical protein